LLIEKPFTFWDFENDLQNDCNRFAMNSSVHASNVKPKSSVSPHIFTSDTLLHSVIYAETANPPQDATQINHGLSRTQELSASPMSSHCATRVRTASSSNQHHVVVCLLLC
jgi:hypothetical protein